MMGGEAKTVLRSDQPVAEISPAGRFFGVFTEPLLVFADIVRKPGFWAPLIALIVIAFASIEYLTHRIGMATYVSRMIEVSGRPNNLTPQQMSKAVAIYSITTPVISIIIVPIVVLVIAALGLLIMKAVFGLSPNFKTAFSVTAHAFLPNFLGGILTLIVIAFGDPANMDPRNLAPTSIGFFLSQQSTSKVVYSLATSADVLSFWVLGLLGMGFAATSLGKAKPRTVFFCFLALWVIWVLIKTGLALI